MARKFTCAYANCESEDIKVTLSTTGAILGSRDRFCCMGHAAAFTLNWLHNLEPDEAKRTKLRGAHGIVRGVVGGGMS